MVNLRKAAVIGCGFVGSSIAFCLMQKQLFSEMVLIDANVKKAEGEAMDLGHGLPYTSPMNIYAGTYDDIADCALIIITAGVNQKPDETRLDLIDKNVEIFKDIIPRISRTNCEGILLIVSNPVDVLTYAAYKLSGFPANRVIGSGTVLDTARLKYLLGRHLSVDSRSVHAVIIGEHGDSELAVWSGANVSGVPLHDFCELRGHYDHEGAMKRIYEDVRDSAYAIIEKKGATYYGIAMAVSRIASAIIRNEHSIMPVSALLDGQYGGLDGLCLSVPSVVGKNGLEKVLDIPLDAAEQDALFSSAARLEQVIGHIGL